MGLDFRRAADLFVGTEKELAMALGRTEDDVARFRSKPGTVPRDVLARMGDVLQERGRGMMRVGEMLREEASGAEGNGAGP